MSLSPEQIAARKQGVGCSEILAALGKDPRCSRLELYMRKRGELPDLDLSDDERVRFGNLLEPVLRGEFERRIGTQVLIPDTVRHLSAPLVGHPDGWMPAIREGVEIKTCDKHEAAEFGEEESDQVPLRYLIQSAGYLAITNADTWHLCVLIGGNEFRTYRIPRDAQLEAAIIAGVQEFWSHVKNGSPPKPETPEDVKLRWPKDLGAAQIATPDIAAACAGLKEQKAELKLLEARVEMEGAHIKNFMAEASMLVDSDGTLLATWRAAKSSTKFDEQRFAKENPGVYARYMRDVPGSRRFLLK